MNTGARVKGLLLLIVGFWLSFNLSMAQSFNDYEAEEFISKSDTLKYRILYPDKYKEGEKYPLLLFLHGAGERGDDNQKQLALGGEYFLNTKIRRKYPAIIVFPQCPNDVMWTNRKKYKDHSDIWNFEFPIKEAPRPTKLTNTLVDSIVNSGSVRKESVYIMGISMGGIGTLEYLYRWPGKYAGAIVICGGHDEKLTDKYQTTPVWFFHGGMDDVVPNKYSKQVFNRLKKGNKNTRYTLFPNDNHNSWDNTFKNPKLLKWLFKQ